MTRLDNITHCHHRAEFSSVILNSSETDAAYGGEMANIGGEPNLTSPTFNRPINGKT